ncbi:hypothetical protein PBI_MALAGASYROSE_83 [Mycobacterium phage MalagasyRose]|uniref:Uncharacterized protein n=1 Tax=Mycobacterium phage MalagasyRose TaxID=2599870 RepID=A0A5J6TDD4_9CAUD|nr:hypothetical protein QEH39_gp05 [Mycobacterium phage MalagasyRose]QFG08931.1 hypothetical protein PBI_MALAGASYROSE_83 [Mycobacterium phage MalagasyRose]
MAALEYVTLTGKLDAIVVDYVDADTHPDEEIVTGFCDIYPRLPAGEVLWATNLTPPRALALAPFRTRFDSIDGQLRTIVGGPVEILACNDALPLDELIYDLVFSAVRYNKREQYVKPFAIRTLAATGAISLTDPTLERLKALDGLKPLAAAIS